MSRTLYFQICYCSDVIRKEKKKKKKKKERKKEKRKKEKKKKKKQYSNPSNLRVRNVPRHINHNEETLQFLFS